MKYQYKNVEVGDLFVYEWTSQDPIKHYIKYIIHLIINKNGDFRYWATEYTGEKGYPQFAFAVTMLTASPYWKKIIQKVKK